MDVQATLNNTQCIINKDYVGYTMYQNLCTGKSFDVSWSIMDWMGLGFLGLFICLLILVFVAIILN